MPIINYLSEKGIECPVCHKTSFESIIPLVTPDGERIKAGDKCLTLRTIEKTNSRDDIHDLYSVICENCGFIMGFDSSIVEHK